MIISRARVHTILSGIAFLGLFIAGTVSAQQMPQGANSLRKDAIESQYREDRLAALWALSDLYRDQGKLREALRVTDDARGESQLESELTITALRRAGIALGLGLMTEVEGLLNYVRDRSELLNPATHIVLLLEQGNYDVESENLSSAIAHFEQASLEAEAMGDLALEARARINTLRANLESLDISTLGELSNIDSLISSLPSGDEKALLALSAGDLYRRAVTDYFADRQLLANSFNNYQLAQSVAESSALRAYAFGFLGSLYEDEARLYEDEARNYEVEGRLVEAEGRRAEAVDSLVDAFRFSNQAIFYAQEADEPEQHYRWEWQLGRIARARNDLDGSSAAYERAVAILNQVRSNFVLGSRETFDTLVGPVYTEYADVLMLQAAEMQSLDQRQGALRQVRSQLEELKQAEIEDYFASKCDVNTNPNLGPGATAETRVAVIYPLILDDRIEILVEAGGDMRQFTAQIPRGLATRTIRRFRQALQQVNSGGAYLEPAKDLYQWLIEPSLAFLRSSNVETLMVVPGGALRTVPMAALHDGNQFLIEQFDIATTPAIGLTETEEAEEGPSLLIGGLTEGVQNFVPLPNVGLELDTITELMPGSRRMQDDTFLLTTVEEELASSSFTIAHFATHGSFSGDHTESFILTYDDRLTLNGLRDILAERGDDPLDLLVLSACETAAGDDRAALGLAGVAVQSGAKSVIATLWQVSDSATTELISDFYRNISPDSTKAASLRQAQLALLGTDNWSHPAYWAPFLLIGSWR